MAFWWAFIKYSVYHNKLIVKSWCWCTCNFIAFAKETEQVLEDVVSLRGNILKEPTRFASTILQRVTLLSSLGRGRYSVAWPHVMKSAVASPWRTSAVCQIPGGLMTYSPSPIVMDFRLPSGCSCCMVSRPDKQKATSEPWGCISQKLNDSVNLYLVTSRPSSPSASYRLSYMGNQDWLPSKSGWTIALPLTPRWMGLFCSECFTIVIVEPICFAMISAMKLFVGVSKMCNRVWNVLCDASHVPVSGVSRLEKESEYRYDDLSLTVWYQFGSSL